MRNGIYRKKCLFMLRWGGIKKKYLLLFCIVMLYNYTETQTNMINSVSSVYLTSAKNTIEDPSVQVIAEKVNENDISIVHPHQSNCYESTASGSWVTLANVKYATDPTYEDLIEFIKSDRTDEIEYDYYNFVCADFAQAVHNNAEKAGIKTAWVSIEFEDRDYGHACNAFNTTDRGMIFIDCTGPDPYQPGNWDSIVKIEVGEVYRPEELYKKGSAYEPMGVVKNYKVYW